jgi:hypothetical protein
MVDTQSEDLLHSGDGLDVRLRRAGVLIFLVTDVEQAKPVAELLNEAATELQKVWPLLRDAKRVLTEINRRHALDDMPAQIHAVLERLK